jgi:DNA-binding IclR family transcriptional regulator
MQQLATRPGVTVSLGTRHELRMTTIESVVADAPMPLAGLFGGRAPIARTAIGHAYLAGLGAEQRELLMRELKEHYPGEWRTIERRIRRDIEAVEVQGYCINLGEWTPQIHGVAVPIVLAEDGLVLSMSSGGPSQLLPEGALNELGVRMRAVRREIERAIGRPHR